MTKELLFWGGRLGAATTAFHREWSEEARARAEADWESKLSALVRGMISSASTPVQTLVARVLSDPAALVEAREPLVRSLAERHAAMTRALEADLARAAFRPDPFHGGLFALLNLVRGDAPQRHGSCCPNRRSGSSLRGSGQDLNALRVTYATVPVDRIDGLVTEAAKAARAGGKSPGET